MSASAELPVRTKSGVFATLRNPVDLYLIVRDVALAAAKQSPDPLKDPAAVSQSDWEAAGPFLASKWGKVPTARQICAQLRDPDGHPYAWRQLLADVFDESIDFVQHHAQRLSAPDRTLSDEHVFWALNAVAVLLNLRSLRPRDYEAGREQLLAQARRGTRSYDALDKALPTTNQITTHCKGSWDRVLEIAMLEPRAATPPREADALAVTQAIAFFFRRHGYLPSDRQLTAFLRQENLACQAWQQRPWNTWCAEVTALIKAQGLPEPNPYPSKVPPPGWQPVDLDLSALPQRRTNEYSRLQALEAVYEFKLSLRAGETPSDKRYKAFARGKHAVPGLNVIDRHGGLAALLTEIAQPDWRERALREQEERDNETARKKAAAAKRKQPERKPPRRNPETRMKFLLMLRDHGPLPNRTLATALNVSRMSVWKLFAELAQRRLVETTEENPSSPNQRYRLTAAGHDALRDETMLRELLARPLAEPSQVNEQPPTTTDKVDDGLEEAA